MIELLKIKDIRYNIFYYTIWALAIYYFANALLLQPLYWHHSFDIDRFAIVQHHQDFFYHTPNGLGSNYNVVRMLYQPVTSIIITPITNLFHNYVFIYMAFQIFVALLAGLFWGKALKHLNIFTLNQQIYVYMILMLFAHIQGGISEIRDIFPWALAGISFYFFVKKKYFRAGSFFTLSFLEHGVGVFFASPLFIAYILFNVKTLWQYYFSKDLSFKTKIFRFSFDFSSIILGALLVFIAIVSYHNQKIVSLPEAIKTYVDSSARWGNDSFIGNRNSLIFIKSTVHYNISGRTGVLFLIREILLSFIIVLCLLINRLSRFFIVVMIILFFAPSYIPSHVNANYISYYFFIGYMLIALNTSGVFHLMFPKMNYFLKLNSLLLPIIILSSSFFITSRVDDKLSYITNRNDVKYTRSIDTIISAMKKSIEAYKFWNRYNTDTNVVNVINLFDKYYLPYKQNNIIVGRFTNKNVMIKHWKNSIKQKNTIYYWVSSAFTLESIEQKAKEHGIRILSSKLVEYGNYYKVYKLEADIVN